MDYKTDTNELVYLLPNEIKIDPRYNVRPFSSEHTEEEEFRISQLAISLEDEQLDDVLITPDHTLFAGHRRHRAALLINSKRSSNYKSLFKLRCRVDHSGKDWQDYRRKAIQSNLIRKEVTGMDLAYLITIIRKDFNYIGPAGTRQVAAYLGIDPATVTQHERFLSAEKELQNLLHSGAISSQSMLTLLKLKEPQQRVTVIKRAIEIQIEDTLDKVLDEFIEGKRTKKATTKLIKAPPKARIENPAIIKAIREQPAAPQKLYLNRTETINSIGEYKSDQQFSPLVRELARYWSEEHVKGLGSPEALRSRFLALDELNRLAAKSKSKAS